ncbi:hypothetical protein [Parasphingorhabdus cellanae]|uniref:C4-dicarboxylate ABC transporter permease n=1 Tax=Parasphingorhabdus cellanae TaxID=2806553 RepID=A0ABX7T638_9SPHN|nr:hypothetical protein [Parasphingorhabdus cellanae]QTD56242.1 hypothetical protein J4G78_01145 [Parasphingorhabdus cellanae]
MSLFENPTQAVGIFAFLTAFFGCVMAGRSTGWIIWRWLTALYLVFAIELMVGLRHGLRVMVNDVMQSAEIYSDRAVIQWALVLVLLALVLALSSRYLIRARKFGSLSKTRFAAIAATVALISVFLLELISFHEIDALLYQKFASVMVIGWIWAGLAIAVMISGLSELVHESSLLNSK